MCKLFLLAAAIRFVAVQGAVLNLYGSANCPGNTSSRSIDGYICAKGLMGSDSFAIRLGDPGGQTITTQSQDACAGTHYQCVTEVANASESLLSTHDQDMEDGVEPQRTTIEVKVVVDNDIFHCLGKEDLGTDSIPSIAQRSTRSKSFCQPHSVCNDNWVPQGICTAFQILGHRLANRRYRLQ
jgi:hypothetical protein